MPARIIPAERQPTGLRLLRTVVRNPIESWPKALFTEERFHWRALGRDVLFIMAPGLIRELLIDRGDAFGKGEVMLRALKPALGEAILTADGERWRWQRRAAAPIFRPERVLGFVPKMIEAAERTRTRWLGLADGSEIDVQREMMRTTFDIIVETMLSGRASIDVDRTANEITEYLESIGWVVALAMLRAPAWMPYPGSWRSRRAKRYLRAVLVELIAASRAGVEQTDDLLNLLVRAHDPETQQSMNERDLTDNLFTFITAGHETTALALTWTFYLLSLHPKVEQHAVEEIRELTGDGPVCAEHTERLVYTRQVLHESLRLYPPAPVLLRTAQRDAQFGGEQVARGIGVYVPIYAVHRHAALWRDPDTFDPDRFRAEAVAARDRYAYLPFGAGPRICIGQGFALIEATIILATLLRSFKLRLRAGYVPELHSRVTLRPRARMPMTLVRR